MYKISIGTVDIISVINSDDWRPEDNLLEWDFNSWEEAYLKAMELKDKIVQSVLNNEKVLIMEEL